MEHIYILTFDRAQLVLLVVVAKCYVLMTRF